MIERPEPVDDSQAFICTIKKRPIGSVCRELQTRGIRVMVLVRHPSRFRRLRIAVCAAFCALAVVAPPGAEAAPTQKAQARSFQMPAGDFGTQSPSAGAGVDLPRLIPIGERKLRRIKEQAPPATSELVTLADAPAGPASNGLDAVCNTNVATGFAPSDIHGAAGPSRLVVVTNVDVGVYNASGCGIVSRVSLKTFFATFAPPAAETQFDPRVIYDRQSGRFFLTVESRNSGNTDQYQYVAVSKDSLASSWWLYRFVLSRVTPATLFCKRAAGNFWDYPQAGASSTRWFISANDFGSTVTSGLLSIDKIPSLSGFGITAKCFQNQPSNLSTPLVVDTASTAFFLSPGSGAGSALQRRNVTSTGTTRGSASSDTITAPASVSIPAWTAAPGAPQPNGEKLDTLDGRFQSHSIQSRGFIWNIHTVNVGGNAKVRWYRLSCDAVSCTVLNSPTFQTSSLDRLFNPSLATGSGLPGAPLHITVSRTIPTTAGSGNAAQIQMYGLNNDSSSANWGSVVVGVSAAMFTACNTTSRGACRWGDYSSTSIDPLASGSAWGFNQLISGATQFDWFTRAGKSTLNLPFSPVSGN